ncbi:response regulator [Sanguibacter antarcticus]|uniref:LuxR family two component transcriptional regulator n=1 Tax=Sanguibacter antarcticus TaxID=372484 RepID=A0A2A9E3Z2_9MICO|nr:response regulator transcription factor [Sanguibacter antarcticus]PFG33346.1 LuxR family two component transcriptional regulator [Sanguibacter antarcticus]
MTIRVLLADDQALIRAGFAALVGSADDLEVVGQAVDGTQAVALAHETHPHVILMDIRMPGTDGLSATELITTDPRLSDVRVLVLTTFESDDTVVAALRAGASGFLGKGVEPVALLDAIRVVAAGESLLSPSATKSLIARMLATPAGPSAGPGTLDLLTDRESEVVGLVAQGLSNDEIATQLFVSPSTAKTHVNRAMTKLGARDRAQLVVMAYQSGLVQP